MLSDSFVIASLYTCRRVVKAVARFHTTQVAEDANDLEHRGDKSGCAEEPSAAPPRTFPLIYLCLPPGYSGEGRIDPSEFETGCEVT